MLPKEFRHVRPELLGLFEELVQSAVKYKRLTGRHLPFLGELGELFAEIVFKLERHKPMAQGSDGKLVTIRYNIKQIKAGEVEDPKLQAGDRIEVAR